MRLIDAGHAIKHWQEVLNVKFYEDDYAKGFQAGLLAVINTPTIDAVPVVRCKDCKNYGTGISPQGKPVAYCKLHMGLVLIGENTFCSYGERKTDGEVTKVL